MKVINKLRQNLKKGFGSSLIILALTLSASSFAQTKVGVVNVQRLMSESKAAIAATKKLEQEFSSRDQEMQRLSKQLQTMQADFDKNSLTMSESDKRRKENDFSDLNREFQRKGRELREDLERRQADESAKLIDRAQVVINKIAQAEKFDLILRDAVYASPDADITDKILKALE